MAEILISLTIIGIIAAITLPALQANINESAWRAQRKALNSRMNQAISMMDSLNGYGVVFNENGTINEQETANKAAQAFVSDGLSKVFKINNICDGSTTEGLKKCGFPDRFIKMGTNSKIDTPATITGLNSYFNVDISRVKYSQIDTKTAAFETANGESVLAFYNPNCSFVLASPAGSQYKNLMQPTMCANFIYDLNGRKGPNKIGKDIGFMTAFYPTDSEVVAPYPIKEISIYINGENSPFSIAGANSVCRQKYGNDAKMANIEELKSIFVNNNLGNDIGGYHLFLQPDGYASSTVTSGSAVYSMFANAGTIKAVDYSVPPYSASTYTRAYCVKR